MTGEAFALSDYHESGGNRFGGAERKVAACMDGNRPVAIARGFDRPGDEEEHYTEVLEILAPAAGQVETRMIARVDEAMDDADFDKLYECSPDCRCAVGDWLAGRDERRRIGLGKALAALVREPVGRHRVQSRGSIKAVLQMAAQIPGVRVDRDMAVVSPRVNNP